MTTRTTTTTIDGIVLAGGLSRRMGRDKALLPWQGRTLLEHMRGLLLRAGAKRVWVSGDYPAFGGIPDQVARCGPLGGLYSVATHMPDGPAWVVPVDTPLLPPRLLQQLRDGHHAPCTIFTGHPLPMLLNMDDACRAALASMLDDPDGPRSLQALQRRLGVNTVALAPVDEAGLVNCNTPEQWEDVAS
ncbi:molybdenum cofactor guanylyltransferase [Stenotrophomonas sp. GD03930]|uniref:molybdenum cofactor guanylyltransferase n=1 Tax=Stenotrophomonas sp. GD03930 TaxID=2975406 RepID=UPI0024488672|nr:molybdenum cofactor guanylyltransferase [Stenotrophomonas sp. GD03930]MDH1232902.1 molybdenum cofactor guanylyltransferase [Stenotrophomonas sp. GD03930]HEL4298085.1 molybdenum cofactor guanylyltransferase [Stenotrophomonas maltophilia]